MKAAYITSDNIITSLGFSTAENMAAIYQGKSGISPQPDMFGIREAFQASAVNSGLLDQYFGTFADIKHYTRFERLVISSINMAAANAPVDLSSPDTLFILSTTKGNVSLLDPHHPEKFSSERINLWASANEISRFFKNPNTPVVVSQACISGVSAVLVAKMYLEAGKYKQVIVAGGDVLSKFVVSGFQSFKALSPKPCKPFDAKRDGLSLGEGAATLILGIEEESRLTAGKIAVLAGATSNDANHISGPSRTGEGLYQAIIRTIKGFDASDLAFINAHGTATPYNDEMEAIAISRAGLEAIPVNSLKGYIGHTLGAAGVIETVACAHSLSTGKLIKCLGYDSTGVSKNIRIITEAQPTGANMCLKTASGFGGCNATLLLKKYG